MWKKGLTKAIAFICVFAMIFDINVNVYAANFATNLTWSSYPSGWSDGTGGLIGSGSTLTVNANETGSDFTYEGDIVLNGSGTDASQGGLVFRNSGSTAYYNSYMVFLNKASGVQKISLEKFTGSGIGTDIGEANKTINWSTVYHLKVVTAGSSIKIYFNNESTPCIDVTDITYTSGKYGLFRAGTPNVTFNNVVVSAFSTNLTWSSYPTGWSTGTTGLVGSGSTLTVNANETGGDFTYEGDITLNGSGTDASQGGLVLRNSGSTAYYNSYMVFLDKTASYQYITLQKFTGSGIGTTIGQVSKTINWSTAYHLKVVTAGSSIKIYFNNESTPCIDVTDTTYTSGKFGLFRAGTPNVIFNNVNKYGFNTNLTFPSYPTGWSTTATELIGSGSTLTVNANETGGDFTYEGDIALNGSGTDASQGGLVFRNSGSTAYYNSYMVFLDKTASYQYITLQKFTGSGIGTTIGQVSKTINWSTAYHLKVVTAGSSIKIYFNNESTPCIDVTDTTYTSGKFGFFRAGTPNVTFNNVITSMALYSLLSSQMGYETKSDKYAYIRENISDKVPEGTTFLVVNASNEQTAFTGNVSYWGQKWSSYWWKLDFSGLKTAGTYYIKVGGTKSNSFNIGDNALMNYDMVAIALDQLDARNNYGTPNTYNLDGSLRYAGRWLTLNGSYPEGIFRDCSSNFAEIESVGLTVSGLLDLYNYQLDKFSSTDQQRIKDYIILGADYITACQRTTGDPATNGRFAHSILVNTMDNCAWAGNIYTWHDMAYAMTVLTNAYKVVSQFNQTKATAYINAAKKAYDCATYRQYNLASEFNLPVQVSTFDPNTDYATPQWSPNVAGFATNPNGIPSGWNNALDFTRKFYNKPSTWNEPATLKTRDKLPFLYACTSLYEILGESKYLNKAIEFADSIQDRQFVNWQNDIEGVYGNFYEFEGDDSAFSVESGQAGSYHMGNIDALSVNGFIKLLQLQPTNANAAKWYNVIKTYTENYVKKAALLNPLGIQPISVYSDPTNGGVKFFSNLLHGATGHYGETAGNFMDLASFLGDKSLADLATMNMHFYTGLNPGIPNGTNAWTAATMINQVGTSYYNTGGEGIKGGVVNGFKTGDNWTLYSIDQLADAPNLSGGQEDWVAHSHPYVGAVAKLEASYNLNVNTWINGSPISASVTVTLPETHTYSTNTSGSAVITDLPLNRAGTISVTYAGKTISRSIETMGAGKLIWNVDFAQYVDMSLTLPANLTLGGNGTAILTVNNRGSAAVSNTVNLSASGLTLGASTISINVASEGTQNYNVSVTAGTKVMPYSVYASLNLGANKLFITANQGLVGN